MSARSLLETAELLAAGSASATELVTKTFATIEWLDDEIRAWATLDREGALAAAVGSDARRRRGTPRSALDGVPVGIKDLIDTAALRTTYGSPLFDDHVPVRDAHVVVRLRAAGAIIVGKTITTEFATYDPPVTRNPWQPAHTPGGSSSGSAASVAAGMVPAAIGSQTGGSTIRPASYCGVVGYVPSPGWVGRTGVYPCAWSLDRIGLFTGWVADLSLLLDGCIGLDRGDPVARRVRRRRRPPVLPRAVGILAGLRDLAAPAMRAAIDAIAALLDAAGVRVAPVTVDLDAAHAAHRTIMRSEIASVHADTYARRPNAYAPRVAALIESGSRISAQDYLQALRYRSRFRRELSRAVAGLDVLLAPAAVNAAEASLDTIGSPVMNLLATFAGLPAISLPVARDAAGLPLGLQLIGRQDDDERLLSYATALEERVGWQTWEPPRRLAAPFPG